MTERPSLNAPAPADANRLGSSAPDGTPQGLVYGVLAYSLWGITPLYYKLLSHVPVMEILAHRIVWSLLFVAAVLAVRDGFATVRAIVRSRRTMTVLLVTSVLVSINWGIYVWAIIADRILEVSFGYYVNPLVSVMLGVVLLGERLTRLQAVAVGLAVIAVIILGIDLGAAPWLPLLLAMTFALYGYFRKTVAAGPAEGVFLEVLILTPPVLGLIAYLSLEGSAAGFQSAGTLALLSLTAVWTAVPLMLFAAGARRLRLATIGLLQYIAPTIQFLLAILVFGEHPGPADFVAFILIWSALALYSADSFIAQRRARRSTR